jgi:hypothetical protein
VLLLCVGSVLWRSPPVGGAASVGAAAVVAGAAVASVVVGAGVAVSVVVVVVVSVFGFEQPATASNALTATMARCWLFTIGSLAGRHHTLPDRTAIATAIG